MTSCPSSVLETVRAACRFRAELEQVELADQAAFLRNCVEVLGPSFRECAAATEAFRACEGVGRE